MRVGHEARTLRSMFRSVELPSPESRVSAAEAAPETADRKLSAKLEAFLATIVVVAFLAGAGTALATLVDWTWAPVSVLGG